MWKSRSDKHCSDANLLAHLDGELRGFANLRTAAHLRRCWQCRAHLSELETQAESLARLMKSELAGQAGRTARARTEFLAWKEGFERTVQPASRPRYTWRWSLAAAAAGACAVAAFFLLPRPAEQRPQAAPTVAQVLRGVESYQNELRARPGTLHQVLRVEVTESRPVIRRSTGRVDIWSDRTGGRYACRWVDERQALKYAVWRRPGKAPFIYASVSTRANGSLFDPSAETLSVAALEQAFFEWLGSRDWQAAPDFSEAIGRDGTRLRVEPLAGGGFHMHASRSGKAVHAEFTMEVEAGSYRPRLQIMRLEAAGRTLELRVIADRLELVAQVKPAVFEPDIPRMPAPPPLAREVPVTPSAPSADEITTEVLYALHRTHACVGGNVQVSTAPGGAVEVRAMVPNAAARAEVAEALERAGVRADIQVVGHARPGPERGHPLVAGEGLRLLDTLYMESLELVRMAERYGTARTASLTPRQKELVETMVRDHVAALTAAARRARLEVEPSLTALAGSGASVPEFVEPPDWAAAATALFRALDRADTLIDAPPAADARKRAAAELLNALAEVEQRAVRMARR
jgi:hypothetical protein